MDGTVRESLQRSQLWQLCRLWVGGLIAVALAGPLLAAEPAASRPAQTRPAQTRPAQTRPAQTQVGQMGSVGSGQPSARPAASRAGERAPARSPKVDHAVMPAGGAVPGQGKCSQCQRSACPQCRLAEGHHQDHHGHSQCQHGLCPAHCPVRPDVFGFYGTRWRKWPGSGVIQASDNEAATPVRPPRAEVPGAEEESIEPDTATGEELPVPDAVSEVEPSAATQPAEDVVREDVVREDVVREDGVEEVVSSTAWRTFTAAPPRVASLP